MYEGYTYADYLRNWESWFGDDKTGDYGYYDRGLYVPYQVEHLTEEQFKAHIAVLDRAGVAFADALRADCDEGMEKALGEMFPHELALLI